MRLDIFGVDFKDFSLFDVNGGKLQDVQNKEIDKGKNRFETLLQYSQSL